MDKLNLSRRRQFTHVALAALACSTLGGQALAQQPAQKISGPQARYWINAETTTGMMAGMQAGGGGFGAAMGALLGGSGGGPNKSLLLELGAVRDAAPASGQHAIPAPLGMGASLPLVGPTPGAKQPVREERDVPEMQQPEGNMRMLFFWGCGDTVGAGQPVILDMKEMRSGKLPAGMQSASVRDNVRGPAFGRDRGYADWPNAKDSTRVPSSASLVGDHVVSSNISPEIRFAVPADNDYLGGLNLNNSASTAGGNTLNWNNLDRALGYFATAMGMRETAPKSTDMVLWNSSSQKMLGGENLMTFLPPAEVSRLVSERVVMSPGTTQCTIPKAVLDAAGGQMLMSNLNAFGPELNVVQPPRPQDPRVEWKQDYAVKLRTRSYTSSMNAMAAAGGSRSSRNAPDGSANQGAPSAADASGQNEKPAGGLLPGLGAAGNVLRGLFGR
jgi:hypothetical protein